MQMPLYLTLLVIAIVLMWMLNHCSHGSLMRSSHHSGGDTLDVAIEYSPITYYAYGDTLGGFNYDLLRLIASHSGRPMKFHPFVTLSKALDDLNDGRVDLVVGQFPLTADNREHYLFTDPIYIDRQVLVQRAGRRAARSQLDLGGDTLHIVKGSPMAERIESLSREIGDTIYVATEELYGPEQLVMMVASGEIGRAVVNSHIAREVAARLDSIDTSVEISLSQFQPWVLKRNNTVLCDSLNAWHKHVATMPAYKRLRKRYFDR